MRGFVRGAAQIRHATCRCGLTIVANDLEKKISHEVPECAWFRDIVAKAGDSMRSVEMLDVGDLTGRPGEVARMEPMPATTLCEVHDWPTNGLAKRVIRVARERHGKGGLNICVDCIGRSKRDADGKRGKA